MRYLLIALLLSSCGLSPEYREKMQARNMKGLEDKCVMLGFKPDTPEMAECKLAIYNNKTAPTAYTPRTQQCTTQNGITQCHSF